MGFMGTGKSAEDKALEKLATYLENMDLRATVRHPTLALGDGARASRLAADARRVLLRLA